MRALAFAIPLRTKSVNESFRADRWALRATAKAHRRLVDAFMPAWEAGPLLEVRLTRISPGTLDDDAVPTAFKHIRDAVAARLRLDDSTPLVRWTYAQEKGQHGIRVEIESSHGGLPEPVKNLPQEGACAGRGNARLSGQNSRTVEAVRAMAPPQRPFKPPSRGGPKITASDLRARATPATYPPKGKR